MMLLRKSIGILSFVTVSLFMQVPSGFAMEAEAEVLVLTQTEIRKIGLKIKRVAEALEESVKELIELEKGTEDGKGLHESYEAAKASGWDLIKRQGRRYLSTVRGFSKISAVASQFISNPYARDFLAGSVDKGDVRAIEIAAGSAQIYERFSTLFHRVLGHIAPYVTQTKPLASMNKRTHALCHKIFDQGTELEELVVQLLDREFQADKFSFSFREHKTKIGVKFGEVAENLQKPRANRSRIDKLAIVRGVAEMNLRFSMILNKVLECMLMQEESLAGAAEDAEEEDDAEEDTEDKEPQGLVARGVAAVKRAAGMGGAAKTQNDKKPRRK